MPPRKKPAESPSKPEDKSLVKATDAQILERVSVIANLLLDGHSRANIQQFALKKWGLAPSTVDSTYFPKAKAMIKQQIDERNAKVESMREDERVERETMALEMHYNLLSKALQAKQYNAAARVLDMINRILGIYAPAKSEVTGANGGAIQITDPKMPDFTGWTTEDLLEWKRLNSQGEQ